MHRFASLLAAGALTLVAGLASPAAAQDASDSIDVGVRLVSPVTFDASTTNNIVSCPVLRGSVGTWIIGDEGCARGAADGITFFEDFRNSTGSILGRAAPRTQVSITCAVARDFAPEGLSLIGFDPNFSCGRTLTTLSDGQFAVALTPQIELTDPLIAVGSYDADILVTASYQ